MRSQHRKDVRQNRKIEQAIQLYTKAKKMVRPSRTFSDLDSRLSAEFWSVLLLNISDRTFLKYRNGSYSQLPSALLLCPSQNWIVLVRVFGATRHP
jgi:hypothetical protein